MRTRISRYRVLKQLHAGATAELLLGSYEVDGELRYAALKQIRSEHAQDQRFLQRFLGEVRLTIALGHKHVVEVHDVLGADGDYVIAMEYVHGADLRTLLATAAQRGAFVPLAHVCAIASAVAAGLHHAHELRDDNKRSLGVVHRNISPSNILIGYDGSIKLGDFGTPKASMQRGDDTAAVVGRTSYFSPEQCKRVELDRRTDVYSLGVVLYELATSSRLFTGDSDEEVMARIVGGDVAPPQRLRPDLPNELSAIILRAIAVDPADRYASAGELRAALDQVAGRGKRATSLAAYVRQQVGDRPEPWRDDAVAAMPAFLTGNTWIEPPRGSLANEDVSRVVALPSHAVSTVAPRTTEGPGEAAAEQPRGPVPPPASAPPVAVRGGGPAKLAMIGVPLVALAGLAIWRFALAGGPDAPMVPRISASSPARTSPAAEPAPSAVPTAAAPVPASAPAAAEVPEPAREVASAEPSKPHRARIPEPGSRAPRPHTSPAPKKISTGKSDETAPPPEPGVGPVATSTPAPPPPPPPVPVAVSAPVVASAPVSAARPAAAAPPAPAPVVMAQVITPQTMDANRIAGTRDIAPDSLTLVAIRQAHKDKITASYKLCVNTEGAVSTIAALQGTGFAAFDAKIESTIRDRWHYRPFLIDGRRSPVCTKFGFVYWPPVL